MKNILNADGNGKENILAIILTAAAIAYVLIISFSYDVGLSPDSTNYLREANALLLGYGFNNHAGAGYEGFFGIWPIGFPALIAVVAFITRLEVVYAAKVIIVGIYIATAYMFIRRFHKYAWVYLLFFCNPGYISCMRYISSENIFMFAVLWNAFCAYDVWESKQNENKFCLKLGISSLFAMLSRWVGAYTLAITGILAFLSFFGLSMEKNRGKGLKLAGITVINAIVLFTYLLVIKSKTGYMTGMYRIPSQESGSWLCYMLLKAENMEINSAFLGLIVVSTTFAAVIFIGIGVFFVLKIKRQGFEDKMSLSFAFSSVIYWGGYVYTRFQTDMEIFNHRVLLPASLPMIVALTHCAVSQENVKKFIDKITVSAFRKVLVAIVLIGLASETQNSLKIFGRSHNAYEAMKDNIENIYGDIPAGSLVITEDWEINFLRMDLVRTSVFDCDSMQLDDIEAVFDDGKYANVYLQTEYLRYLFSMEEDISAYDNLLPYAESDEYLIKIK